MNYGGGVIIHPAFVATVRSTFRRDKLRAKLQAVMEPRTFERVRSIIQQQPIEDQKEYYEMIYEPTCHGEDFSQVKSIDDIGDIYALYFIHQILGE